MEFQHKEIPLYYQLESVLREKIRSGDLAEGTKLPTENELIEQYGVSRVTVRQALAALVRDGLLERVAGRGTFVKRARSVANSVRLTGFMEEAMAMSAGTRATVLDARFVKATLTQAQHLQIGPDESVWCLKRVRYVDEVPYAYVESYFPEGIGRQLAGEDLSLSVLRLLEEKCRINLGEASAVVTAALADAYIASLLNTKVAAPLLMIDSTFYDLDRRPVQFVRGLYRSDLYSYTMTLVRNPEGTGPGWQFRIGPREERSEALSSLNCPVKERAYADAH